MGKGQVAKLPKKKCCVSTKRCSRCPLRMLKEGTLPEGYTVKKRRLVKTGPDVPSLSGSTSSAGSTSGKKKGKKKGKKAQGRSLDPAA